MAPRGIARAFGLLVVAAAVSSGCGVPTERDARSIAADDAPLTIEAPNPPTTVAPAVPTATVGLCFIADDRLVVIPAEVRAPATAEVVVEALLEGPTAIQQEDVRSALVDPSVVRSVAVDDDRATVDLGESFTEVANPDQMLALAQIVCTLSGREPITKVRFTLDGEAVDVPRADGSLTSRAVTIDDYAELIGRS